MDNGLPKQERNPVAQESSSTSHDTGNNSLTLSLAMIAGLGFILMASGAAVGVIGGESANDSTFTVMVSTGAVLFLVGVVGWGALVRPWENFDDINIPYQETEHPHSEEHLLEAGETKTADMPQIETTTDE